ncbi:MAG: histidine kinase, partial [Saprospiraceae bacterium]|nr:histidine kinase [Saprospiraceae bacterium]
YIENYLELEKLRHGEKMDIHFELEGEVSRHKVAPLMFIPFLENSFKHGLKNQIDPGFVDIKMVIDTGTINVHIENSKSQSLPAQINKRSGGIGLKNVRRRLNILYPNKHELNISENPKTYSVDLKIEIDS